MSDKSHALTAFGSNIHSMLERPSDKSHALTGHNVYKMTDVTHHLSTCVGVTTVTAALTTGISYLTRWFKSLDIKEKRT